MFARLEILRDRHRAHHDAGLVRANGRACVAEEPPQRDTRLLQARLMIEHLVVGVVARRLRSLADGNGPGEELRADEATIQGEDFLVELLKPLADLFVRAAGVPHECGLFAHQVRRRRPVERSFDRPSDALVAQASRGPGGDEIAKAETACLVFRRE